MGMPQIEFRLQMFRGDWDQVWSQMRLLWLMEGLCRVNQTHFQQFDEFKKKGLVERGYPSVYRAGLHYETEKGTEIWPDVPSLLSGVMGDGVYPGPWGDCLPLSTLVMKDDYEAVPISSLKPGDRIMGNGSWTTVLEYATTGVKKVLAFDLDNGSVLRCSPEHRLFLKDGTEIRAKNVGVGDKLMTPTSPFPESSSSVSFDKISKTDLAWLIGTYVADGWHEMPRHGRFAISGKDPRKDGLPRLKRDKTGQKLRTKAIAEGASIHTRWHERYIAVNDAGLSKIMASCGGHAPEKRVGSMAMSLDEAKALLEGLRADASFASSGTATHGTTSPTLAIQLRILYRMLGQSVHIKRWDDHGGLGSHPVYRITVRKSDAEVGNHQDSKRNSARVVAVREEAPEMCCDITTESGKFWLPESDVVVHNCEDLACYRVAEYRELPWHYERTAPWDKKKVEQLDPAFPQGEKERAAHAAGKDWPGWKKVKGGIKAKPYAKWRRGPTGSYHYHALCLTPDGRLEDPSLVLGMGKEGEFNAAGTAKKLMDPKEFVTIMYAKKPTVMVVDPEKPSGYAGGKAGEMDEKVKAMAKQGITAQSDGAELGAYLSNEIALSQGEIDVDAVIGWNRAEKCFEPKTERHEHRRLLGYSRYGKIRK